MQRTERTFVSVPRVSRLTDERLDSLYEADGFGGEKTMRARVIRELIDVADRLERAGRDADMLRFRDPTTGAEQWLGRDTPFDTWQTWDDPRRYYPGDPTDVLDERLLDLTSPALPFTPDDAGVELDGIGVDF